MSTPATVPVFDPQGVLRDVPQEQLAVAVKSGGIPAVKFQAPDKSTRFVPANRIQEASQAGGKIMPLEDQDVQHPGFWSTLYDDVKGMASGLVHSDINPIHGMTETKQDLINQRNAEDAAANSPERMAHGAIYRNVTAPLAESVGVNVPGMEKSAAQGDIAGVGGHAVAPLAVMAATEGAARGIPAAAGAVRSGVSSTVDAARAAAQPAVGVLRTAADAVSPDVVGLISPRIAHAQRLAGRLANVLSKPAEEFVNPGAPLPEAPSTELAQGRALTKAGQPATPEPADALGSINVAPSEILRQRLNQAGIPSVLDRLRNQELAPAQPDYVPARPSIERIAPESSGSAAQSASPATTPKAVGQQLETALGGQKLVPGVPLRYQPEAQAAAAGRLPEGFTPVESSALKGYKYDPQAREFESITSGGQHYVHGDVSPEEAQAFEDADSKGRAWVQIRQNPLIAKVVNGNRVPILKSQIPEAAASEAASSAPQPSSKPDIGADLTNILNASLKQAKETPRFVYRARDVGEQGVPLTNEHASATTDPDQATRYAEAGQRSEQAGEVVKIDLRKLKPSDYVIKSHPSGAKWVQFTRPLSESEVSVYGGKNAGAK